MNLDWTYPTLAAPLGADPWFRRDFADLSAARRHICSALPAGEEPHSVSIFNVWWIPGKSFEVIYELHHEDGRQGYVTVAFMPEGELQAALERTRSSVPDPAAVSGIRDWSALLLPFPNDAGLSTLPSMLDFDGLSKTLRARFGPLTDITSWSLLSYLPRERASICYRLDHEGEHVAGKIHKTAADTHRAMTSLWQSRDRTFRMPEPVAFDADLGMRWERFLAGSRIDLAAEAGLLARQIDRTLRDLASLHRLPLGHLPTQGRSTVLNRIVRKVTRRVVAALPEEALPVSRFMAALSREAERLPPEPHVTMHGDFHTGNVLFDGDAPGFIDLDSLAYGEAAYDLALFASRLLLTDMVMGQPARGLAEMIEDLPRRYRDAGGAQVSDAVFSWYMAALLVGRQLKTSIRHVAPDLPRTARLLIGAAEAILDAQRFRAQDVRHLRASS